jgi:hypothetical protein
MLLAALSLDEEAKTFAFENLVDYIKFTLKRKLLTVIDEAQKYYSLSTSPKEDQDFSSLCITQIYRLGIETGSSCVLCSSSSKLIELALQHQFTKQSKDLVLQYARSTSLNNQKFKPIVLSTVAFEELNYYLEVCSIFVLKLTYLIVSKNF